MPECMICDKPVDMEKEEYVVVTLHRIGNDRTLAVNHASCEGY